MTRPRSPCDRLPDDPADARLLGLYAQRQEGRWMQRIKVFGGRLSARQWRALARLARDLTPATPLHLTTRQDVELHDLAPDAIPAAQRRLADAGFSTVGACGDTPRNITICPGSGVRAGRPDLAPLAREVQGLLEATDGIWSLPRKFKISFSACPEACAQPWINDLGFILRREGAEWSFRVVAGGSLGARPGAAMLLEESLPPDDVLPMVLGAVRFFAAHGDRTNRTRARLRHVREKMGDEPFADALREALIHARGEREWPHAALALPPSPRLRRAGPPSPRLRRAGPPSPLESTRTLVFANGDITPDQADALADLADAPDLAVRLANHHRIQVFGPNDLRLDAALAASPALAAAARPQASVVACPGTRWCRCALADTNRLADRLRGRFAASLDPSLTIALSGCPNGCAHSAVADVGLVGTLARRGGLARRDGIRAEAYTLLAGGGMGRDERLAETIARRLSADEAVEKIAEVLQTRPLAANGPPRCT